MTRLILYAATASLFFASCRQTSSPVNIKTAPPVNEIDTSLKWVDYHIGEPPPEGYYTAFDSVIKKWNIRYQRIEGGCEGLPDERRRFEKDNPKYFALLKIRFGEDWLDRFHADVKALDNKLHTK
ncbi:hypothetical protein ABDD95_01005 [Mucilaginibacter sp. PAMB04274]|uniref:hypothetical protein n=1 Tax=Mucilaginibacter sp. PAMB04274 TaxID=3138568 RepID=UPI0031F6B742